MAEDREKGVFLYVENNPLGVGIIEFLVMIVIGYLLWNDGLIRWNGMPEITVVVVSAGFVAAMANVYRSFSRNKPRKNKDPIEALVKRFTIWLSR
jgi:hypothetical protein